MKNTTKVETVKVGGINFNVSEIKGYDSVEDFVKDYGMRRSVTEKQLRDAYAAANPPAEKKK